MAVARRKLPSKTDYMKALADLMADGAITDAQIQMLRSHSQAADGIVSTKELALAAGYKTSRPVNVQYGRLGSKLREVLGKKGNVGGQKSHIIASFHPPSIEMNFWLWIMHKPLRAAIEALGWFDEDLLGGDPAEVREYSAMEGEQRQVLVFHRKREKFLRAAKLADTLKRHPKHRVVCEVPGCGFDFEAMYGKIGSGFAEVHHRVPLSEYDDLSETTLQDLAVVCPNCHRMIHRGGDCRDLETLIPRAKRARSER